MNLNATVDPRFERVHALLAENIESGFETGLSFYVSIDGEPVVDVWGGWTDQTRTAPWAQDTAA